MSTSFRALIPDGGGDSSGGVGDLTKGLTSDGEYGPNCKLSKKQSLITLPGVALGNPAPFAIMYTVGNIIALTATFFLWGPKAQLKSMFKPIRAGATVTYLVMIILTLVLAFTTKNGILVLICLAVQFCAMVWYAASYIPYGRALIKKTLGGVFKSIANEPA